MKKVIISLFLTMFAVFFINADKSVMAEELKGEFTLSNGGKVSSLTDDAHKTTVKFKKGDTITISSEDGTKISGVYVLWDNPVKEWTLTTDSGDIACGKYGYLHEYVKIDSATSQLTITIPADNTRISQIRIFSEGELPRDVQVWNPPCEKADIMVVVSHADDEILFFGGILSTYSYTYDASVQVVYMAQFWDTSKVREHEKLDGLWEAGIRYYPTCGYFGDVYSGSLKKAETQYDYEEHVSFLVSEFRRCNPQVVVTHDINGEYGHGYHMFTCKSVQKAVEASGDATKYTDSYDKYGVWDVPKTYIHLYKENAITLDLRVPIEEDYAGRTAFDIAVAAYEKHVSQQWCWFYVSDSNKYSCADFGLYRTLVGADTDNDLLCNLKTYKVQEEERLKAEEESRKAEQESIEQASREQASIEAASREQASIEAASREQESIEAAEEAKEKRMKTFAIIAIVVLAVSAVFVATRLLTTNTRHKKRKRK